MTLSNAVVCILILTCVYLLNRKIGAVPESKSKLTVFEQAAGDGKEDENILDEEFIDLETEED